MKADSDMILSANGTPFRDHDAASLKASVMTDELGQPFRVVTHPSGGYAVMRGAPGHTPHHARVDQDVWEPASPWDQPQKTAEQTPIVNLKVRRHHTDVTHGKQDTNDASTQTKAHESPGRITLHPAWRAFWKWHLLLLLAAIAAFNPYFFLTGVMRVGTEHAAAISQWQLLPLLSWMAASLMALAVLKSTYGYYANRYQISPAILETTAGIIAQDVKRIEYRHIRSVNVSRGVIERILGIGNVEVSTAATDGGDLILFGVANPLRVQEEIERRKHRQRNTRGEDHGE